jgi:hypothetical protein
VKNSKLIHCAIDKHFEAAPCSPSIPEFLPDSPKWAIAAVVLDLHT